MKANNKIISIISFGILVLFLGIILRYTTYKNQSEILIKMGLIFELYASILYLFNQLNKNKYGKKNK